MRVAITRKAHFNAAHRLYIEDMTLEENLALFGKCANVHYHGHNYDLEVRVTGEIDQRTGMVMDLKDLKDIINNHVEERFDHKNLNLDCPEFKNLQTSAENICIVIFNILREQIDPSFDLHIRLYETPRNFVEYPA